MLLSDGTEYHVHQGDCITHMLEEMPPHSVDFSVFSPPFPSVYAYTAETADLGNSEDLKGEARIHFSYFFRALKRVLKPGRVILLHCTDIIRMKRAGGQGVFDFTGLLLRLAERAGLIFEYRWAIRKNPQSQAIRTKSHELQFAGLERDRAGCRGAMPDYLLKFRAPGENAVPIVGGGQVTRNDWISWAEYCWDGVRETDTLNVRGTKGEGDTKHICPLQLPLIDRAIRLFSNPGEIVFSPFAGIGSELYGALKRGRRAYGCELKPEYHAAAVAHCERALSERKAAEKTLFDALPVAEVV